MALCKTGSPGAHTLVATAGIPCVQKLRGFRRAFERHGVRPPPQPVLNRPSVPPGNAPTCCPAGCYIEEGNGRVVLITAGCLECGTCRIICDGHHNVDWEWPRGGFGIPFKFG